MISSNVFNVYIQKKKIQFPQYLIFRYGMTHLSYSSKKLVKTFILQKKILKTEMNHDEIDGNNNKDKKSEWLDYVKNDVLCSAFSFSCMLGILQLWKKSLVLE